MSECATVATALSDCKPLMQTVNAQKSERGMSGIKQYIPTAASLRYALSRQAEFLMAAARPLVYSGYLISVTVFVGFSGFLFGFDTGALAAPEHAISTWLLADCMQVSLVVSL